MISISQKGDYNTIEKLLSNIVKDDVRKKLEKYGEMGVKVLKEATPKRTGKTSESWSYEIIKDSDGYEIQWNNSNVVKHENIAVLIQMGHGTGRGTYVRGRDYINPALKEVFDDIAENALKEVYDL